MTHRAGFVNIIGNPNVGKSTIMNELVGEKLAIITSKAQTTRHRIMGIVNGKDFQIVYSDTPGIIQPSYRLQEEMMQFVKIAIEDADVILYITDVIEKRDKHLQFISKIKQTQAKVILIINKIDLANEETTKTLIENWEKTLPKAKIIPLSALHKFNLDKLFDTILEYLPENPPFYPKDTLTDRPQRFFVSEIIREKILLNYKKEIPYSVEVEIEGYIEEERIDRIRAIIYVMRETQKGIIIGHRGSALKKTGTQARMDIEKFIDKKVFLELFVKVKKDWRDKEISLRNFGYK